MLLNANFATSYNSISVVGWFLTVYSCMNWLNVKIFFFLSFKRSNGHKPNTSRVISLKCKVSETERNRLSLWRSMSYASSNYSIDMNSQNFSFRMAHLLPHLVSLLLSIGSIVFCGARDGTHWFFFWGRQNIQKNDSLIISVGTSQNSDDINFGQQVCSGCIDDSNSILSLHIN